MNRYRTVPGLTGQSKASPSTTCQKCLKKGHYSFECKESVQARPYVSRPSRTQQLLNPSLAPRLASDTNNELLRKKGIADEQLAQAEAKRAKSNSQRSVSPEARTSPGQKRPRSTSSSSHDSISTISTNRSRSRPPKRGNYNAESDQATSQQVPRFSRSPPRKRKHDRLSSESMSRSPSRSRSRDRKSRRHRKSSPDDRGRSNAHRRGSHRSRSRTRSLSMDKSRVAKQRRSLDDSSKVNGEDEKTYRSRDVRSSHRRGDSPSRRSNGNAAYHSGPPPQRKERSLSPYSRRLALTQSMNMTR